MLVARDGRTLFEGAYGLADRELDVQNTPVTQFRVGSMNKMLTAVATLQLVQAGTLRLDAPLGTYLPDYPNAAVASTVTPHHLLTHTGGTGDIFGAQFTANRTELRTTGDYLRLYGTRGPQFAPGAQHVYSNYGFMLLGRSSRAGRLRYDDYVASRCSRGGMTATAGAGGASVPDDRWLSAGVGRARVERADAPPRHAAAEDITVRDFALAEAISSAGARCKRTPRCSTRKVTVAPGSNTPTGSSTVWWAAGDSSGTAAARRA